jgi:hypothetical protein
MKITVQRQIVPASAVPGSTAKPMSLSAFARLRPFMRPVLSFVASQQLLSSRGIRFARENDDLDTYRIARYEIAGVLVQLLAYDHSEKDHISIYVDVLGAEKAKYGPEQIAISLMVALQLSEAHVHWVNDKFPVPVTLQPQMKVRVVTASSVVQAKKTSGQVSRKIAPAVRQRASRHTRELSY